MPGDLAAEGALLVRAHEEGGAADHVSARGWALVAVLTAINMFSYMDRMALSILLQAIKLDLGLTDTQLGLLTGFAFVAFFCIMGLPLARLADRASRVRLLAVCVALWSAATALTGLARGFPHLFLARMGVGIGEAGCTPAAHSLVADVVPVRLRTLAIAIVQTGTALGTSAGMVVVGLLGAGFGWRNAMLAIGLAGIPLAALLLCFREPPRRGAGEDRPGTTREAVRALFARPAYVHLLIAMALACIPSMTFVHWTPTLLMRSFGLTMAQVGAWLGTLTLVTGVVAMLIGGLASSWLRRRDQRWELWLPALAMLLALPFYVCSLLSRDAPLLIGFQLAFNLAYAIGAAASFGAIQSFAGPRQRGLAVSVVQFASAVTGMGLAAVMIGGVSDLLAARLGAESLRYAMLVSLVAIPWSALHYWLASRHCTMRTGQEPMPAAGPALRT